MQDASEKYTDVDKKTFQRFRDIKMYLRTGEALRVLAVENQNQVDYTLPYRCMQYDVMEYGKQIKELQQFNRANGILQNPAERLCGITKGNRLAPVYTLCLYHGTEPWDGPLALLNSPKLWNEREKYMNSDQDKEEYNMCQALQEIFDDGISQGVDLINLLNQKLIDTNRIEDLKRAIADSEYRYQLFQEFHIEF